MKKTTDKKSTKHSTAVFGSAFNPPHRGHEDVIAQALEHFDKIIVVPNYSHAFGKKMAPFEKRLQMAHAMVSNLKNSHRIFVSDIEKQLAHHKNHNEPIYTYDVLKALEDNQPCTSYIFILGPDNAALETWNKFYRGQDILDKWGLWAAQERLPIRSTAIRNNLAKNIFPTDTECNPKVIDLLKNTDYYRNGN